MKEEFSVSLSAVLEVILAGCS